MNGFTITRLVANRGASSGMRATLGYTETRKTRDGWVCRAVPDSYSRRCADFGPSASRSTVIEDAEKYLRMEG